MEETVNPVHTEGDRPLQTIQNTPIRDENNRSLLSAIICELMSQRRGSPFVFDLSSTIHKWLQGAAPEEQELVLEERGFVRWIIVELLIGSQDKQTPPSQPDDAAFDADSLQQLGCDTQQVLLDLLGELVKFNARALAVVSATLASVLGVLDREPSPGGMPSRPKQRMSDILDRLLMGHMVNASVFVHCVELTLGEIPKPKRRRLTLNSPAVTHALDDLIGSAKGLSYECRTAKDLKLLLERRSLDASRCLEKSDLVSALRQADIALIHQVLETNEEKKEALLTEQPESLATRTACDDDDWAPNYLACIWRGLRPRIALKLLVALAEKADNRFSSDLCVINATIVLFSEAKASNRLEGLFDDVTRMHTHEQSNFTPIKGSAESAAPIKEGFSMVQLVDSFIQALEWWTQYYDKQNYEKRFMEFQSGISLDQWQSMVNQLLSVAHTLKRQW